MKIKCLIIDDEKPTIDHLIKYINKVPFLQLVGFFTDPSEAIAFLENINSKVDVVFLDIQMPNSEIDGIDVIEVIGNKTAYILTTSYPQYALDGFNHQAIDFLHKPYSFDRFMQAVNKLKDQMFFRQKDPTDLFIKTNNALMKIVMSEICWIESERNYISIYTTEERYTTLCTIKDIETKLPPHLFSRIHKSYIVSIQKIHAIENNQVLIKKGATEKRIPIGNSYKNKLLYSLQTLQDS